MNQYTYRSDNSWTNFLIADAAASSVKRGIAEQTRALVASNEQVANSIDASSRRTEEALNELNATFNWGVNQILVGMGHLNDSLKELIALSRNPSQTWAYEQFSISRDAFRKQLYSDALAYVLSAISGSGGQTGYRLDHRFHMLLGLLYLGNQQNAEVEMIDLDKAEQAFLDAAKYARQDYPNEAGQAMLSASWAAYCNGDMDKSQAHVCEALRLDPTLPEAYYQDAKIKMHLGQTDFAVPPLRQAITYDRNYTLKATEDDDFLGHPDTLNDLYSELQNEACAKYRAERAVLDGLVSEVKTLVNDASRVRTLLDEASKQTAVAEAAAGQETYFGYLDAQDALVAARTNLADQTAQYLDEEEAQSIAAAETIQDPAYDKVIEKQATQRARRVAWTALLIVGAIFWFFSYGYMDSQATGFNRPSTASIVFSSFSLAFTFMLFPGFLIHWVIKVIFRSRFRQSLEGDRQHQLTRMDAQTNEIRRKREVLDGFAG